MANEYVYNKNMDTIIYNGIIPTIEKIIESGKEHEIPVDTTVKRIGSVINSYNEYYEKFKEETNDPRKIKIEIRPPENFNFTPEEVMENNNIIESIDDYDRYFTHHPSDNFESMIYAKICRDNLI